MASTSETTTEKATEDKAEEAAQKKEPKNMHVALPWEVIDRLKNVRDWGQMPCQWSYDEEKLRQVWELQSKMSFEQLFHHLLHGDGEEVVWDDDVFGVQQIKEIPQPQPQPQPQPSKNN